MSGDVLSQAEVENLLSAMDGRESDADRRRGLGQPTIRHREKDHALRLQAAGARRQGADAGSLQSMHEGFGRNFGARSRPCCARSSKSSSPASISSPTASSSSASRTRPASTCSTRPAAGRALDSRHQPVDPVSDHRPPAGRRQRAAPPSRRPLTEIELRLVSRITDLFLEEMKHAWENVLDAEAHRSTASKAIRSSCRSCRRTKSWC